MRRIAVALIALFFCTIHTAQGIELETFNYQRKIILNTSASGANITTDIADFPVLIRLTPSLFNDFSQTLPGGADIRFAKPDGTPLPYEIERWIDGAGDNDTAEIWVKVDTILSNDSTQYILMYYGNASAVSASSSEEVFDTAAGYALMTHLSDQIADLETKITEGTWYDADGEIRSDSAADSLYSAEAQIGLGIKAKANGSISFPRTVAGCHTYTMSCWFRPRTLSSFMANLIRTGDMLIRLSYGWVNDARVKVHVNHNIASPWYTVMKSDNVRVNRWHHTALVVDNEKRLMRLYVDGELAVYKEQACEYTFVDQPANKNMMTLNAGVTVASGWTDDLDAFMDQVEVAKVSRSADWIKLAYENQRRGQKLVNLGEVTTGARAYRSNRATKNYDALIASMPDRYTLSIASNINAQHTLNLIGPGGRTVRRISMPAAGITNLDIGNLPSGLYFVVRQLEETAVFVSVAIVR